MDHKTRPCARKIYMQQYIQQYICAHAVLVRPIYWCAIYIIDAKKYFRHFFVWLLFKTYLAKVIRSGYYHVLIRFGIGSW